MIGIDIVQIERIEQLIEKYGQKGLERFLLPQEMEVAKKPQTVAGFWAAKEAVAKALKTGIGKELGFHDIFIYKTEKGAPEFKLLNGKEQMFRIQQTALSISHDAGVAVAVAVIIRC
ncbi:holo-ACP synthase [Nitratiruptor sp. SB155-2]|uniref:Holo-[acyl-carrier-protein] synthase n=1 Tax=Nitratiruptor sp. (strain SB155-2) TaxID=387092 RepID=ACPS_NITSB|nr:holo-ACP synthase [Nitratiruptor sp. SB155-2]A6Q3W1.1 RecName: Full=Holo-[acyl-carrier-protein] synthase; Short=Holo-ACP synthase; AltName: Full=4'-phosphopantetheinyl transferase AcpS [Nitratiruptor sp. SB155-2]BAF70170.1 holo-[acyl-carrier protein] synthase [Nitratiruptor sp. SB155-2]